MYSYWKYASSKLLKNAPIFSQKIKSLTSFLEDLPKPVCLVAHNGNAFDFRILLAECNDANISLPSDLMCLDSLIGFIKLLNNSNTSYKTLTESPIKTLSTIYNDIITEDEGDWPDLNLSPEEWQELDNIICLPFPDISCDENFVTKQILRQSNRIDDNKNLYTKPKVPRRRKANKENYTLPALYKRLLNKEELNAQGAEVDCLILLQCVIALKADFLSWADGAHKRLNEIKPLIRH